MTYGSPKFGGKSQIALSSGHERDTYHHYGASGRYSALTRGMFGIRVYVRNGINTFIPRTGLCRALPSLSHFTLGKTASITTSATLYPFRLACSAVWWTKG